MAGYDSRISRSEPRQRRSREEFTTMKRKRGRSLSPSLHTNSNGFLGDDDDHRYNSNHKRRRKSRQNYPNSPPHNRFTSSNIDQDLPLDLEMSEDEQYKQANINMKKLQFFEEHSDSDWLRDIYDPSRETCVQRSKEMLEAVLCSDLDRNYVETVPSEKYGTRYNCKAEGCSKGFKELNFIQKHLKGKHPDLVRELTEKAIDRVYFNSYMNDRDAPYPEQRSDLPSPPTVVMPIIGAGPLGPFVGDPFEIAMEVMGQLNFNSPLILPGRSRRPGHRYVDLDAPQTGATLVDYRTL